MDKGTNTHHLEIIIHEEPKVVHQKFLERIWWGGGLPWFMDVLPTHKIQKETEPAGTNGIRQVPLFIQEEILEAKMGEYIMYTLKRKVWFPVSYHRGRVQFINAAPKNGPACTRVVWEINYTPYPHAPLLLPVAFGLLGVMLGVLKQECEKDKKKSGGSFLGTLIKLAIFLYLGFIISRAVRIPNVVPLHPGQEYVAETNRFRAETKDLDAILAKNTYLVIGGSGFTGSALVDDLRKRGAKKVKIMGRSFPPSIEYPYGPSAEDRYPLPDVEYVRGDVTDLKALREAMKDVTVVFHIAVTYGSPSFGSLRGNEVADKINVGGMKNIYNVAKESGTVKQIIYTSSADTVFTTKELHRVNETHPYAAYGDVESTYAKGKWAVGDNYARTKILAEEFLLSQDNKDGIRTVSLRPNGIYGPGEFSAFKKAVDVPYMLGFLPFYFDETQKSDWSCVYNLVYAHILATAKLATDPNAIGGKAYFITDDELTNNAAWEIFKPAIEAAAGPVKLWLKIPSFLLVHGGHAQEVFDKWMYDNFKIAVPPVLTRKEAYKAITTHHFDNSRARKDLGYKPLMTTAQCQMYTAEEVNRRYNA